MIIVPGQEDQQAGAAELAIASARTDLAAVRRILSADELYRMKDVKPRLEKELRLPGDSRARNKVWLFSLDGVLDGNAVKGALFAGECILVQGRNFEQAFRLAKDGVASTIELLEEEFRLQHAVDQGPVNAGLEHDAGGSRARGDGTLKTDPKMRSMLAHVIGGLPWKW